MKNDRGIAIERVFDAPPELVWQAWTEPRIIKHWWGPEGFSAPSIKTDLRVGGKYVFAMHGPAGSEWDKDMYSAGIYEEIVPNKKMVVTDYFSDEHGNMMEPAAYGQDADFPTVMTATVLFEETPGGGTLLSIIYPEPARKEQMEAIRKSGMKEGWKSSLNKLEKCLTAILAANAAKEGVMDECEEKKLMDKVMGDPDKEFVGKDRVCDNDVENVLWKLGEEPKAQEAKNLAGKKTAYGDGDKGVAENLAKDGTLPGMEDIAAHSVSP